MNKLKVWLLFGIITVFTLMANSVSSQSSLVDASIFSGNAGDKIYTAISALPSEGGTVDARNVVGLVDRNMFIGLNGSKSVKLLLACGGYTVTVEQKYQTNLARAKGLKIHGCDMEGTIIDNQVENGSAFNLDGNSSGASNSRQLNSEIKDLTITNTSVPPSTNPATSPVNSNGITMRSQWRPTIENVRVESLSAHAIQVINNYSDSDATAYMNMNNVSFSNNGGNCLYMPNPTNGQNASGSSTINHMVCSRNHSGGIRLLGLDWKISTSSISYNIGIGLSVPYVEGTTMESLEVTNCEFDGNHVANIDLQAAVRPLFVNNKHITSDRFGSFLPTTPIKIGSDSTGQGFVIGAVFDHDQFRRDGGLQTSYVIGSNALYPQIKNPFWTSSVGITRYSDPWRHGIYLDDGQEIQTAVKTTVAYVYDSYSPDLLKGTYHRIIILSPGTFHLDAPIGASDGRSLELDIVNASGSLVDIVFDSVYAHPTGFINPISGKSKSAIFRFSPSANVWRIMGSWSGDF